MKTNAAILFFSFLLTIPCSVICSEDALRQKLYSFINNVNAFTDYLPQEKVYLHFDNSSYFLGETIWFKSYVVLAEDNEYTDVSRTLYVELLNPEGNIIDNRKLLIENGQCHGEFLLPDNRLYSGFYEVRAYTRYMLNFDQECIFSRIFPVFDKPAKEGDYTKLNISGPKLSVPSKRLARQKADNINVVFFLKEVTLLPMYSQK